MIKRILNILIISFILNFIFCFQQIHAQDNTSDNVEMADKMRSEGKIYVVVLVVAIVFTGLTIFAIATDRKVSRLEKDVKNLKSGDQE